MEKDRGNEVGRRGLRPASLRSNRMPEDSPFYERIVPILLIVLAVVTVSLIIFAAGVLLGFVPFQ